MPSIIRLTNISDTPLPFVEIVHGAQTPRTLAPGKCGFLRTLQFYGHNGPLVHTHHGYGFGAFLRDGHTVMIQFPRVAGKTASLASQIRIEAIDLPEDFDPAMRESLCPAGKTQSAKALMQLHGLGGNVSQN